MPEPAHTTRSLQVGDLPRINEISIVLARNGFGHLLGLLGLVAALPAGTDKSTAPFARRLRQVLVDLGPTFVKLGQILAVRPDILPRDVMTEFETLQDRVAPMDAADVRDVVEEELGQPLENVFSEFDFTPLGSASIAQVHRARVAGGPWVAVKLQRKGVERTIRSDVGILYTLANLAEGRLPLPGLHTPRAIVREFDVAISQELDFLQELRNAERMAKHFEELSVDVGVPAVYSQWSTRRLLVMELIEGVPLHQAMQALDKESAEARRIAHAIMEATWRQVFDHGFFHGDPHPGNLFLTSSGRLVYLDFGLVGALTGSMQDTLVNAFTSMVFRDAETLALTVHRAGATKGRVDLKAFTEELDRNMTRYYGASLDELATPATLMEVVELCTRYHISLPPEFAVLSRAITLVESEVRTLLPNVDIVDEVKPYAQRLLARRFSPERVAHDAARLMVHAQGHFRDLPTQLNQMLLDLQSGNVTVITKDPEAERLREEIRAAVLRLSLAAAASTVTLGSLLFLAAWSPDPLGVPVFGLVGGVFLIGGLALFGALGIHVFFAGFLSLGYWRRLLVSIFRFLRWRRDS